MCLQVEAGLILHHHFGFFGIRWKAGQIVNPTGSSYRYGAPIECASCRFLKYRLRHNEISMSYSADGKDWKKYPRSYDIDLFTGFGGLKIAIYAAGSGQAAVNQFTYRSPDGAAR